MKCVFKILKEIFEKTNLFIDMHYKKVGDILSEKYRYLFISELGKIYDLAELLVEPAFHNDVISELQVDLQIDDTRANNGDSYDIGRMLREADDYIREFLYKYPVNPKTAKIDTNFNDFIVHGALFLDIEYKLDEKHYMLVTFRVDYEGK